MRAISRTVDVSINTVSKVLEDAGNVCLAFHDQAVRNLQSKRVQVDEVMEPLTMSPVADLIVILQRDHESIERKARRIAAAPSTARRVLAGVEPATTKRLSNAARAAAIVGAPLRVDGERPAERVQAEGGIRARQDLHAGDGRLRNQIPVHDIAERLVDAHAVLEYRNALRKPEHGRCCEPAEVHVGLEGIALRVIDRDAGGILLEEIGYPVAPLVIGVLLGAMADVSLRRALLGSSGSIEPFVSRPVALILLVLIVISLCLQNEAFKRGLARGWDKLFRGLRFRQSAA